MYRNFQPATEVRLGSGVFAVQLATTDEARIRGLSGVDTIDANGGLLMIFPNDAKWGIWMKDMKVPLDIIWMNNDKKVIYIVKDALQDLGTSKTFHPDDPARYVLEVPAGMVKNAGIKIGLVATFQLRKEE